MACTKDAIDPAMVEKAEGLETQTELELGSDDKDLPLCDLCEIEDSRIPAAGYCKTCGEYLCNQCYGYHCKPKPMRHHVLVDAQNMPKSKSTSPLKLLEDCQEKCHKHETVPLKIYCKTHDEFCCVVCLSDDHKTCDNVSFIQDCSKDISDSKEYLNFQKDLQTLEKSFNAQLEVAMSEGDTINAIFSTKNTTNAIEEMTVLLDECRNIDVKIDDTKTTANNIVEHVTTTCIGTIAELQPLMSDKTSDAMKFINMKRGKLIICEMEACLQKLKTHTHLSHEVIEKLKSDIKSFQERINKCALQNCFANAKEATARENTQYTNINIVSKLNRNIKGDEENNKCRITGSAILTDGRIALVDFCNRSVKIHSPQENNIEPRFTFESNPFDAAEVHQGQLVVTVPSQQEIYLFSLNGTELTHEKTITTSGSCHGICSDHSVIFVAFDNPPKVEMLNMNGNTLKSFVKDFAGEKLFSSPWYVTYSPVSSKLYVTDRYKDSVTCLTTQGEVVSVYKAGNLVKPYGVAVDSSGTAYVCARNTNSLYCLSPDFKCITVIKDDVYLHKAESVVCWNKCDRLYVGLYQEDYISVLDIVKS